MAKMDRAVRVRRRRKTFRPADLAGWQVRHNRRSSTVTRKYRRDVKGRFR
jgi:hypothetical protein